MALPSITGTGGLEIRRGGDARDITPFVYRYVSTESMIEGGWSWSLTLNIEQWKEWERLLLGQDENPGREFRLNQQDGVLNATSEWMRAFVDGSKMDVRGRALSARVWGADVRLKMQQFAKTRAWPDTSVAEVIRRIAAEYDLIPDVQDTLGRRNRWQLRQDDWTYMSELASYAATGSRRGDSYLWVDDDAIRFKAPNLGIASDRRHDLSEADNRADKVLIAYHGRRADRCGGASLLGVSYEPLEGQPIRFLMDGAAASTQPAMATKLPRPASDGLRVVPFMYSESELVEEKTRGWWGGVAPRYFSMRLTTRPDLTLRPGNVVEVQANLNERQNLAVFGRYVVLEVQHVLENGHITTTASCFRREAFVGDEEPTGSSVSFAGTRDRTRLSASPLPRSTLVAEVLP